MSRPDKIALMDLLEEKIEQAAPYIPPDLLNCLNAVRDWDPAQPCPIPLERYLTAEEIAGITSGEGDTAPVGAMRKAPARDDGARASAGQEVQAEGARWELRGLLEKIEQGEVVTTVQLFEAIQAAREAQARLDPDDGELYDSLEDLIRSANQERDRRRVEEKRRHDDITASRKYERVIEEYNKLLRQGERYVVDDSGNPVPINRMQSEAVDAWRAFVHEKIAEKLALADRQIGYPSLALGYIEDAWELLDGMLKAGIPATAEDRATTRHLEERREALQADQQLWEKADQAYQQAIREKDAERALQLLLEARAAYPAYPDLETAMAEAEAAIRQGDREAAAGQPGEKLEAHGDKVGNHARLDQPQAEPRITRQEERRTMSSPDKIALIALLEKKIEEAAPYFPPDLLNCLNEAKDWDPAQPCPIPLERYLSAEEIAEITSGEEAAPPGEEAHEAPAQEDSPREQEDETLGDRETVKVEIAQAPTGEQLATPTREAPQASAQDDTLRQQLAGARRDLESDEPHRWRRARATAEEIAKQAGEDLGREASALAREAGRKVTGKINRLVSQAKETDSADIKRRLCDQILALEPSNEWANDTLAQLDTVSSEQEVQAEVQAAQWKLQGLQERIDRGETVTAMELFEAIQVAREAQARLDPDVDGELHGLLEELIRPIDQERDRRRTEEGQRVTDTARRQYQAVIKEYDEKLGRGETHIFDEAGNPVKIQTRRDEAATGWRAFVHEKIVEKLDLANRQARYPSLALSHIEDAWQLLDGMLEAGMAPSPEDKAAIADLEQKREVLEADQQLWEKADEKYRQAILEKDAERRLELLREADAAYSAYPGLKAAIARAELTLANVVAARIRAELDLIRGEVRVARSQDEITGLLRRCAQLLTRAQEKGVQSRDLEAALQDREELLRELERAAEFVRETVSVRALLAETPPALSQALELIARLRPRFPEREGDLDGLEIRVKEQGDDQQKYEAARQSLELHDDPEKCLETLAGVERLTPKMEELQQRATVRQYEKRALQARRDGRYEDALTAYEVLRQTAPGRKAELETLIRETRRERDLVAQAEVAIQEGKHEAATEQLKEALKIRGDELGVDARLDQYKMAWRDKVIGQLQTWLEQGAAEDYRSMRVLVETARDQELLLNAEDQHLADQVETLYHRQWAVSLKPSSDPKLRREDLEELEALVKDEPDLADDLELHYKLAHFWLLERQSDKAREYIRKCRNILKTSEVAAKLAVSRSRKERRAQGQKGLTRASIDQLQRELDEMVVLKTFAAEVESRVLPHGQADSSTIDGALVKQLCNTTGQLAELEITGDFLRDDFHELAYRAADRLLEDGKGFDAAGPTVEGLQRYQWAARLLDTFDPDREEAPSGDATAGGGFRGREIERLILATAKEFPRLVSRHTGAYHRLLTQLQASNGLPIAQAHQEAEGLLEQAYALQDALEMLAGTQTPGLDKNQRADLDVSFKNLKTLATRLALVRTSVQELDDLYAKARSRGDLAEQAFEDVKKALDQVKERCRDLGEGLVGRDVPDDLNIEEVEEMRTLLEQRLPDMVRLPIKKDVFKIRSDESVQVRQVAIPDPYAASSGVQVYSPRMCNIGDLAFHELLVKWGRNLQDAWLEERFDIVQEIHEIMTSADLHDRYHIQQKLYVQDAHQGIPVRIEGLPKIKARLDKKIEDLAKWESVKLTLEKRYPNLAQGWEVLRLMGPDTHGLEERLAAVRRYLNELEPVLLEVSSEGRQPLSSRAEGIYNEEVHPKEVELRGIQAQATDLRDQLEAQLEERGLILDKLMRPNLMEPGETPAALRVRALEIDPTHGTVQALCSQKSQHKPPTKQRGWLGRFR